MRILRLTLAGLIVIVVLVAAWLGYRQFNAYEEKRKETAVLQSLHRGQSRKEFYRIAKEIGVAPIAIESLSGGGENGPRSRGVEFPLPTKENRYPSVFMYFANLGGLFLWTQDRVDVFFDADDNVLRWTVTTSETGV